MPSRWPARRERRLRIARRLGVAVWACVVGYRTVTGGFAFNRELLLALHLYRPRGRQHRPGPPRALRHPGLAAVRARADRLRPQQGSGHADRPTDDVALAGGRRSLAVLRHHADGVAAGAVEAAAASRGGRSSSAPSTCRSSSLPYVVAAVLWLRDRDEWKAFVRLFVGLIVRRAGRSTRCFPPRRRGRRPGARPTTSPPARRTRGACSAPAVASPTAACSGP